MLVVISACQEENILETQNIEVENTIKVKNGILSFSNKATLKKMVEGLKKKEVEGRNAELSEYYDKGFKPLFPNYLENDPRLEEYYNFKKKSALKIPEKSPAYKSVGEYDEDGEYVEEFDDDLISDDEFASLLNQEREIIVGDSLYKYTYSGMFKIRSEDKPILDQYIDDNDIEYLLPDPGTIPRGITEVTPDIKQYAPTTNDIADCTENNHMKSSVNELSLIDAFSSCGGESDSSSGGGGSTSGGGSTGGSSSTVNHYANMVSYIEDLDACDTSNAGWNPFGIFGTAKKCFESFSNSKYRTKTKYWNENYGLWRSVGVKVKHQKKGWLGWRSKKTDEVALSVSHASFEFKLPIHIPANHFHPQFYFFENNIYNSQAQILQYYTQVYHPPLPELPWNSEVTILEFMNANDFGASFTVEQVRQYFYTAAWRGAKQLTRTFKGRDPERVTHILYDKDRVFINFIDLSKRKQNSKKIVDVFDYNFGFTIKFNVNFNADGSLSTNINDFGDVLGAISIPQLYEYENVSVDFVGVTRRGDEWKGSRLVYND